MRAVNLLPRSETAGKKTPPLPVLVACIGTVLVTAVLAVMFLSASSQVGRQQRALDAVNAELAQIPAPPAPSPVVKELPQQRQTRVSALATVLGQRVAWDRLLREVSQVVPSDVWLVTLNALSPAQTAPTTGTTTQGALPQGFVVTGCTYSQDSVARFLARLEIVPDLSDMTLGKSQAASAGASDSGGGGQCPKGMFTFTLQGNVHTGAAAS
ncbi:MAG TPA: PilN domain-containing protein [Gaiellaceae bacterium]